MKVIGDSRESIVDGRHSEIWGQQSLSDICISIPLTLTSVRHQFVVATVKNVFICLMSAANCAIEP